MIKDDERYFLQRMQAETGGAYGQKRPRKTARDIINEPDFPIPYKRAWYLLEKWSNQGVYDYGVTVDLGWITEKGMEWPK